MCDTAVWRQWPIPTRRRAGRPVGIELRALTAQDVRRALVRLAAGKSTRTVTIAHNAPPRVVRHAEANRHVVHNVAALVDTSKGQPAGRARR
jgi:hypothetical protein